MSDLSIVWAPRVVLTNRTIRIPVASSDDSVEIVADSCELVGRRWSAPESTAYFYLQTPREPGDVVVHARRSGSHSKRTVQVRDLNQLREPDEYNGAQWPRRWPLGQHYKSVKSRQTLQDEPRSSKVDEEAVSWWLAQPDEQIWRQLPNAELPKAHFVNAHQGCPVCGTAVYRYSGFYPWVRNHAPCDFRSTCPSCDSVFPSNNLMSQDFGSGPHPDDGFGYFDEEGHIWLFAATYHRDQCRSFAAGVSTIVNHLRAGVWDDRTARCLAMMMLRYAEEEAYVAAAPQFRYGPSRGLEEKWQGGQPDWAAEPDPVRALARKGSLRYSIDTPKVGELMAVAYDTIWPLVREDQEVVSRAQVMGLPVSTPSEVCDLLEETLAILLQVVLDRGAGSNLPRESVGALMLLRGMDRPDAQGAMDWLYDEGPDRLRVFGSNDFFPDGTPPESTGGYNSIHTNGLFEVEHTLRGLRYQHPEAYPASRYPSLTSDPRTVNVARQPNEITMVGKTYFQFGDGHAPGSGAEVLDHKGKRGGSIRMEADCHHAPMQTETLAWAAEYTNDPVVNEVLDAVKTGKHREIGTTVHDGVGIAILRTGGAPERAAAGVLYGDTTGHRHRDLLDVQLFAYERPFLTDLGYPQSWASRPLWEDHWSTHNTIWGTLDEERAAIRVPGRGRLVRSLLIDGLQVLDVEAYRWAWDSEAERWYRPGVTMRRLVALVETDDEGVALVDLARVTGGAEHWRTCRGLEGELDVTEAGLTPRPGTVASPEGARGDLEAMRHPDHAAFAHMDQVSAGVCPGAWTGSWESTVEPGVHLDLYQTAASPGAELLAARGTAVMGTPEESGYAYRMALWRRRPTDQTDTTCVDLVFEPRVGDGTLQAVAGVVGDSQGASGVVLDTRGGRQIALYWAPFVADGTTTRFDDGAELDGPLAAVVDGRSLSVGASRFNPGGKAASIGEASQTGLVTDLNRSDGTVDVSGISGIAVGDRVVVNPEDRGHNYGVVSVEPLDEGVARLKLDVTSVLGRGKVASLSDDVVEMEFGVMARTGNLNGTRLETDTGSLHVRISEACNLDRDRTHMRVEQSSEGFAVGNWVRVVDYVVGDTLQFDPLAEKS